MGEIFIKSDEKKHRKEFLSLIVLVFTLLIGSSGMQGNALYYLSFLAASLYYYLLLERKKISGSLMMFLPFFIGISFTAYLTTVYAGEELAGVINFAPLLYAMIFGVTFIGLLPENVRSEWKKRVTGYFPENLF
jgi:hypothetical protein